MQRGSTPIHEFAVSLDLRLATVWVTYQQKGVNRLDLTNDRLTITEDKISLKLTQEETLSFEEGRARVQIRYLMTDGSAGASSVMKLTVEDVLKDGVI